MVLACIIQVYIIQVYIIRVYINYTLGYRLSDFTGQLGYFVIA